jgi:hypothetical protein
MTQQLYELLLLPQTAQQGRPVRYSFQLAGEHNVKL